jgi:hypothetical protein
LPDLSPLDYGIWCILYTKVNATAHPNVDSLEQRRNCRVLRQC